MDEHGWLTHPFGMPACVVRGPLGPDVGVSARTLRLRVSRSDETALEAQAMAEIRRLLVDAYEPEDRPSAYAGPEQLRADVQAYVQAHWRERTAFVLEGANEAVGWRPQEHPSLLSPGPSMAILIAEDLPSFEPAPSMQGLSGPSRDVIGLVAAAYGPVPVDDLAAMLGVPPEEVPIEGSVLHAGESGVVLREPAWRAAIEAALDEEDRARAAARISRRARAGTPSDYALRYGSAHLDAEGAPLSEYEPIVSPARRAAWGDLPSGYLGFATDLERCRARARVEGALAFQLQCALVEVTLRGIAPAVPGRTRWDDEAGRVHALAALAESVIVPEARARLLALAREAAQAVVEPCALLRLAHLEPPEIAASWARKAAAVILERRERDEARLAEDAGYLIDAAAMLTSDEQEPLVAGALRLAASSAAERIVDKHLSLVPLARAAVASLPKAERIQAVSQLVPHLQPEEQTPVLDALCAELVEELAGPPARAVPLEPVAKWLARRFPTHPALVPHARRRRKGAHDERRPVDFGDPVRLTERIESHPDDFGDPTVRTAAIAAFTNASPYRRLRGRIALATIAPSDERGRLVASAIDASTSPDVPPVEILRLRPLLPNIEPSVALALAARLIDRLAMGTARWPVPSRWDGGVPHVEAMAPFIARALGDAGCIGAGEAIATVARWWP